MNPMNHTSSCKGCSDHYKVTEEQINRILSSNLVKNGSCVPDELYERRLGACRECARLLDGTTCMLCGCIVRVSAKFVEKRCPHPGGDRWMAEP